MAYLSNYMAIESVEYSTKRYADIDDVSMDGWQPDKKGKKIFREKSHWRTKKNKSAQGKRLPSRDDYRKITYWISKRVSDVEIMDNFNISQTTLNKIRRGVYCPASMPGMHLPDKELEDNDY